MEKSKHNHESIQKKMYFNKNNSDILKEK